MSHCPHCHGTGHAYQQPPTPYRSTRVPDSRRMIPHGNEVMAALRAGTLEREVHLYCGTCPSTKSDRWALAAARIAKCGTGTAMVLPEGADPSDFRYPALDVGQIGVSVAAFAYGLSREQQHALGHALLAAGLQRVAVLGGLPPDGPMGLDAGPLMFEAV
jgi:hypothetical protein